MAVPRAGSRIACRSVVRLGGAPFPFPPFGVGWPHAFSHSCASRLRATIQSATSCPTNNFSSRGFGHVFGKVGTDRRNGGGVGSLPDRFPLKLGSECPDGEIEAPRRDAWGDFGPQLLGVFVPVTECPQDLLRPGGPCRTKRRRSTARTCRRPFCGRPSPAPAHAYGHRGSSRRNGSGCRPDLR